MFFAIVQRLWQMLFVMFGISVMVFLIFFATPGADPASRIAGRGASPEILEAVRGDSFQMREFHDALLSRGAIPVQLAATLMTEPSA